MVGHRRLLPLVEPADQRSQEHSEGQRVEHGGRVYTTRPDLRLEGSFGSSWSASECSDPCAPIPPRMSLGACVLLAIRYVFVGRVLARMCDKYSGVDK
jgi:hypothetical protein